MHPIDARLDQPDGEDATAGDASTRGQQVVLRRARSSAQAKRDRAQKGREEQCADESELGERLELERVRLGDRLGRAPVKVVTGVVVARADTSTGAERNSITATRQ